MNMNQPSQREELIEILAGCDDKAGHHVLWVSKKGDVFVTQIPEQLTPVGFEKATPEMQMRYETFQCGNDYVGERAAKDQVWVLRLFKSLLTEWPMAKGSKEAVYIDLF